MSRRQRTGEPKARPESRRKARCKACQKGQKARSKTCQMARGQKKARRQERSRCQQERPRRQERPRDGDLTKERIGTEKFQQLEQKNSNKVLVPNRTQKTTLVAEKHKSLQKRSRRQKRLREQENQPREQCVARTVAKKSWSRKEAVTGRKLISQ